MTHPGTDAPDVLEGNAGEQAAPVQSDAAAEEGGQEPVAAEFATFKATEAASPATVQGMGTIGLRQDVFKGDLEEELRTVIHMYM